MATLKYVGTPAQYDTRATAGQDLINQSYINFLLSQNMSMPQVTNQINTALSGFATTSQASSLMSGLATPAWIQTQEQGYIAANRINLPNGPVALSSATGTVQPGQIAVPGGSQPQQWPQPFWSPASYNTGMVTATTTPQLLYTLSVSDPGYPYKLFCAGMADCLVGADTGAYAEVFVAVGSTTGQTIAQGNSSAESYTGPAPGDLSAQALMSATAGCTPSWNAVGTLAANNAGTGFSSTVISNYLQCPTTMIGTLNATVDFTGAVGGWQAAITGPFAAFPVTTIRIIRSDGTVYAQSNGIGGGSGQCFTSYTGQLTAGQLFTVQGIESGIGGGYFALPAGNYGSFVAAGASLNISPGQVQMESMANIIPVPLGAQTTLMGPTTLYVMLASSDNSTSVSADIDYPGLWVMPIPWGS